MCGSSEVDILGKRLNKSQGRNPHKKSGITTSVLKCKSCGLIYSNPMPIPTNIQDHYGIPPEDYWDETYFIVKPDYFSKEINSLKTLLPFSSGQRVLDVGAGIGKCMISLESAGYDVFGFEPSLPFYQRAISKMKIPVEKLKLSSVEDADYPDAFFDFITFGAVLEHLYNPDESIKKALSWLKPKGVIHIEVPSSDWIVSKILNFYYSITGKDYVTNLSPMHAPYHLYEFGLKSFQLNGLRLGYEVVKYEYFPCDTFMPKFLDKPLKLYMEKTNSGMQLSIWLQKK
jgi:2-polyprenyl-3-methyl-5-hydroxy-6-metoxy-1,4-benzoquinol methylase